VHVSLREKNGELGTGLNLHYGDLDLAAVPKKERAVVLVGAKAGRYGTVTVRTGICYCFSLSFTVQERRSLVAHSFLITNQISPSFFSIHREWKARRW